MLSWPKIQTVRLEGEKIEWITTKYICLAKEPLFQQQVNGVESGSVSKFKASGQSTKSEPSPEGCLWKYLHWPVSHTHCSSLSLDIHENQCYVFQRNCEF